MILLQAVVPRLATDVVDPRPALLSGPCELIVHLDVVAPPEPARSQKSERDDLDRRRTRVRRQEHAFEEVRCLLTPWTVDSHLLNHRRRLAVLVDRLDADRACEAVAAWGRRQRDLDALVTGPWPPFSFREEDLPRGARKHG